MTTRPLLVLRWMIAVLLAHGAVQLLVEVGRGAALPVPGPAAALLAIAEIVAAVLFVVPRTVAAGGWLLGATLAAAAAVHVAAGERPPLEFVIYGVAIWAIVHDARGRRP